jgi:type IV pilus assembly protein PilF
MTSSRVGRTAAWAAAAMLVWVLGGCANRPPDDGSRDIVTESDESEARKRARIRMELAVGYFEQGQNSIALDEVKQVIAIDPGFPDAYNLRGLVYMRLNDQRQAEESFRRAVALNPRESNTLHNLGWLQCQQARYDDADRTFEQALAVPTYAARAKTLMAQGLCHIRAKRPADAERALARAYELDAANPIVGFNLANLLFQRGEMERAQFYIRRLNNSERANAETLWLGIRVERRMGDRVAMAQLADQLRRRFPQARELAAFERGAWDE